LEKETHAMTSNEDHPRYQEVDVASGCGRCPQSGSSLKIIVFMQDAELRSHAVKHLLDLGELETVWRGVMTLDEASAVGCIGQLQRLGCPGFALGLSRPPCKGCRLYGPCGAATADIEDDYLRAIRFILEEGGRIPRFACYWSDHDGYEVFVLMPDRPVVVKASLVLEGCLNVMTCYGAAGDSFTEMRRQQVDKMMSQTRRKKNIVFCREEAWGIAPAKPAEDGEQGEKKPCGRKPKKKERKSRKTPWRQYLNQLDEE